MNNTDEIIATPPKDRHPRVARASALAEREMRSMQTEPRPEVDQTSAEISRQAAENAQRFVTRVSDIMRMNSRQDAMRGMYAEMTRIDNENAPRSEHIIEY